mgnify:CR=1 FL=1
MARKPMATSTGGTSPRTTETIEHYLAQQQEQDLLRFITCGSVDDGKSTLIGRLLWDAQQLTDDQLATLKTESKKHGTQGDGIDFALLVAVLSAEREQGITIDVAYRFFATRTRKFIVADTPGHEQYTRNMVTGASTADLAVILVDARQGVLTQTRRHAYLVSLMGIRHVVLAVNKMDLQGFDASVFQRICEDFETFATGLGFASITPIPLSALRGDNITQRSMNTPWYAGPTLLGCLETIEVAKPLSERLVFPVQWVNRPDATFRGFSGYLSEGRVRVGDEIRVTRSGQTARIAEIVSMDGSLQQAVCGDAVTLRLDKEIDASRGDILSLSQNPLESTDQFEATLVWMDEAPGLIGRNYDIKLATQWASASITGIKHRVDINTLSHEASTQLGLNDISLCAGMITHSLRRAQNVHSQALTVSRAQREQLNGHKGKVIWFTGLSGSGKSTIANALEVALHGRGYRTYILDGDNVRQGLNKDLGFTDADRVENIRRIAEVAKLMLDAGLIVMTAFISPFIRERQMARDLIGADNFVEVYVSTSLEVCEQRDVKGLYKKARNGQLPNLSGIGSPYEAPTEPDLQITSGTSLTEAVERLLSEVI